jgi:AcrR family transcriptional regulator
MAPSRRTQAERSAETTAAVLDATVRCLVDLGFGGTTITSVASRAAVSRGAVLHHYPSKEALILAAVQRIVVQRTDEARALLAVLPADASWSVRLESAIDVMWSIYQGPSMLAWLELALASRADAVLRELLVEQSTTFDADLMAAWQALFPRNESLPEPLYGAMPGFLHTLLKGLAVDGLTRSDGRDRAVRTLTSLKLLLRLAADADPAQLHHQLALLEGDTTW